MEVDEDINNDKILLDKKSYKNVLIYKLLYKKFIDAKLFPIKFNKVDGLIKIYNGIRYLELSNSYDTNYRVYNKIFDEINYLITEKIEDKYSINHNFARIKIDSFNSLPMETKIDFSYFHNVIILVKSVVNKDKNYYYNIFSE